MFCLIGGNFGFVLQREADVVEALEQAVADEFVNRKCGGKARLSVTLRFSRSMVNW